MKKLFAIALVLTTTVACSHGGTDKSLSFLHMMDTQAVELHSAIDTVIVTTMAVVGLVQMFFN